jgi:hypothetical protein
MESQVPQTNPAQQQGAEDEAAKRAQEEQMRRDVMATVLDTAARERRTSAFIRVPGPVVSSSTRSSIPNSARQSRAIQTDRGNPLTDGSIWPTTRQGVCPNGRMTFSLLKPKSVYLVGI